MSLRRAHIPVNTKYASVLLQMRDCDCPRIIPHEHAKLMSDDQIISLFHCDHDPIPHAEGGPAEAWNLTHRLIAAHREKTAKVDVPTIAKGKRLRRNEAEGSNRLLAKYGIKLTTTMSPELAASLQRPRRKAKIPARVNPWPKGRKFQRRGS